MATSTPNLKKKTKIKKKNEEELLQELSRVEMEKTLLQVHLHQFACETNCLLLHAKDN